MKTPTVDIAAPCLVVNNACVVVAVLDAACFAADEVVVAEVVDTPTLDVIGGPAMTFTCSGFKKYLPVKWRQITQNKNSFIIQNTFTHM